jgi:hypothetical protein
MRSHTIFLLVISGLMFMLAFVPQQKAQAKTCYDQAQKTIPCPKSNYLQTQQAAKQAANSISSTDTPIPPTETPSHTLTNTPFPTPTSTPTFTPTPTSTPLPTTTQPAAQLIVPVKLTLQPNACDPRIWQGTAGLGFLLALAGILAQALRRRFARRSISQVAAGSDYSTESKANTENLDTHIGRVDFGDGSSDQDPDPAGPIAFATTGIILVLASAAGILKLIPCSAWMAALGGSALAGLAAAMIDLMFRKQGMGRYMSGRIKVTGNEKLVKKMKDDFDEQK